MAYDVERYGKEFKSFGSICLGVPDFWDMMKTEEATEERVCF